jgi:hypothetical protein
MLPGSSGIAPPILAHLDGPGTNAFPPASRVSISEMLGGPTDGPRASLARVHTPEEVVVLGNETL